MLVWCDSCETSLFAEFCGVYVIVEPVGGAVVVFTGCSEMCCACVCVCATGILCVLDRHLDMSANQISDSFPSEVAGLPSLT
jgi:hypothetical protein